MYARADRDSNQVAHAPCLHRAIPGTKQTLNPVRLLEQNPHAVELLTASCGRYKESVASVWLAPQVMDMFSHGMDWIAKFTNLPIKNAHASVLCKFAMMGTCPWTHEPKKLDDWSDVIRAIHDGEYTPLQALDSLSLIHI